MLLKCDYIYTHVISANDIWIEEQAIKAALKKGGYNPSDLNFNLVAAQAKVREIEASAEEATIPLDEVYWNKPDYKGDVEVALTVSSEVDHIRLRLLFGGL